MSQRMLDTDDRVITEKGESFVPLTMSQAAQLQSMKFCRVTPTNEPGLWRISDVNRVGVVVIDDVRLIVRPKTPLRSLIFMASHSGRQADVREGSYSFDADLELPSALAAALISASKEATRRGLVKGYVPIEETGTVIRGRWDIARQLRVRPGIPVPVELNYDDYTEDVPENRILKAALRTLMRHEQVPAASTKDHTQLMGLLSEVSDMRFGTHVTLPPITRLNTRYEHALRLAKLILDAVSWAHAEGRHAGSAFLLNVAKVFEDFVGRVMKTTLEEEGYDVKLQDPDWTLDIDGDVMMEPDIVIRRGGRVVTIADTKYKVFDAKSTSPPNPDVYQALAYATAGEVPEVHLLYAAGEVEPRRYRIEAAKKTVVARVIDVSGGPEELVEGVRAVGWALVPRCTEPERA